MCERVCACRDATCRGRMMMEWEPHTRCSGAPRPRRHVAAVAEQAAAAVDGFDDTYLGAKSSEPTVDNDGDALNAGDLYYNTTDNNMKVYNGSAWENVAVSTAGFASAGFSIAMSIAL